MVFIKNNYLGLTGGRAGGGGGPNGGLIGGRGGAGGLNGGRGLCNNSLNIKIFIKSCKPEFCLSPPIFFNLFFFVLNF